LLSTANSTNLFVLTPRHTLARSATQSLQQQQRQTTATNLYQSLTAIFLDSPIPALQQLVPCPQQQVPTATAPTAAAATAAATTAPAVTAADAHKTATDTAATPALEKLKVFFFFWDRLNYSSIPGPIDVRPFALRRSPLPTIL
jgi:hypothetical protein